MSSWSTWQIRISFTASIGEPKLVSRWITNLLYHLLIIAKAFKVQVLSEGNKTMESPSTYFWHYFGSHFLCWISGVVLFNTWLISSWEENNRCYKLSNWQIDNYVFSLKMTTLTILCIWSACNNIYFLLSLR